MFMYKCNFTKRPYWDSINGRNEKHDPFHIDSTFISNPIKDVIPYFILTKTVYKSLSLIHGSLTGMMMKEDLENRW